MTQHTTPVPPAQQKNLWTPTPTTTRFNCKRPHIKSLPPSLERDKETQLPPHFEATKTTTQTVHKFLKMNGTLNLTPSPAVVPDGINQAFWFGASLGTAYFLLCSIAFVLFARVHYYTKSCTKQKSVQGMVILSAALRTSFWLVAVLNWTSWFSEDGHSIKTINDVLNGSNLPPVAYILNNIPGLMYFSTISLLLNQWGIVYYTATDQPGPYRRCFMPALVAINLVMWVLQLTMWTLYFIATRNAFTSLPVISLISTGSLATVYIIMSIAIIIFGLRTKKILRDVPIEFSVISKKVVEVGRLTQLCAACFTLRALLIVWGNVEPYFGKKYALSIPITIGVVMSYYVIFEIFPCIVVLYYYRRLPPRPPSFPPNMFDSDFDGINSSGGLRENLM